MPSVDSAIIIVDKISKEKLSGMSDAKFFEIVRAGFAAKRKLLSSNLGAQFGKEPLDEPEFHYGALPSPESAVS